ncbi:uncharacterized protein LOC136003396 [Lathamus discolor]|uniref:uncharacterized protein LOC136003396 n=1 Tax=Lathamus discolor TaxID=678569 RepID=UPI0032B79912
MDPAVPRATLKVLGLCAALLVLVAAVTVAVAVMVWHSEAVGKLRGCQERAANESRELGNAVAELERERVRLQRAQDALRRELAQAHGDSKKLNGSLVSCRERAVFLAAAPAGKGPGPSAVATARRKSRVPPPSGFIRLNNGPERLGKCSHFPGLAPGWALARGALSPPRGAIHGDLGLCAPASSPGSGRAIPTGKRDFPTSSSLLLQQTWLPGHQEHGDSLGTRGGGEKGQDTAHPCPQARLVANVTALEDEVLALQWERDELARGKAALEGELARGEEQALGLRQQLEQAMEQQRALRARRERCEAQHRDLEATLRDYAAQVDALQRQARNRGTRRRKG